MTHEISKPGYTLLSFGLVKFLRQPGYAGLFLSTQLMRSPEEITKDNFYKVEEHWAKKNFFQAWVAASMGYWLTLLQGNDGTGFFGGILVGLTIPITYAMYMYYAIIYWWSIRRYRVMGGQRIFEFNKGWKFAFQFYRSGYNDYNYPQIRIAPIWGQMFMTIPYWPSKYDNMDDEAKEYGFYIFEKTFVICHGKKKTHLHFPWSYDWYRTSYMFKDYTWYHELKSDRKRGIKHRTCSEEFTKKKWSETYPYTYVLKNGTVQERLATVTIDEREWRQRWLMWTPWFNKVRRTIDISFNEEIGERVKSWKGGTIGCSYDLLPNESPEQCLRRMEKERKFDR